MHEKDQIISLEIAMQLKALRLDAHSYFKWELREGGYAEVFHSKATSCAHAYYAAYTTSELDDLLPIGAIVEKTEDGYEIGNKILSLDNIHKYLVRFTDVNSANVRGKMLIHILTNKMENVK